MVDIRNLTTKEISIIAVLAALTTVATASISIPFPATKGYFNLGDVMVVTSGLLFGPVIGALTGGIGSALADIVLQYHAYAPFTLIIKGAEGYIVGYLAGDPSTRPIWRSVAAWIAGSIVLLVGYYVAEILFLGYTPAAAFAELATINILQAGASILGIPISIAVRDRLKSYLA